MRKWEYFYTVYDNTFMERAKDLGSAGWELINTPSQIHDNDLMIFKREIRVSTKE